MAKKDNVNIFNNPHLKKENKSNIEESVLYTGDKSYEQENFEEIKSGIFELDDFFQNYQKYDDDYKVQTQQRAKEDLKNSFKVLNPFWTKDSMEKLSKPKPEDPFKTARYTAEKTLDNAKAYQMTFKDGGDVSEVIKYCETAINEIDRLELLRAIGVETIEEDVKYVSEKISEVNKEWHDDFDLKWTLEDVEKVHSRVKLLEEYYEKYEPDVDISDLIKTREGLSNAVENWDVLIDRYKPFENADDYNVAVRERERMKTANISVLESEIEELETKCEKAEELKNNLSSATSRTTQYGGYGAWETANSEFKAYLKEIGYDSIDDLKKELTEKRMFKNNAQRLQYGIILSSVGDPNSEYYDAENYKKYVAAGKNIPVDEIGKSKRLKAIGKGRVANTPKVNDNLREAALAGERRRNGETSSYSNSYSDRGAVFDLMTDEEFNNFYYYLGMDKEDGGNLTQAYLNSIIDTLNARRGQEIAKMVNENTWGELGFALETGLDRWASGIMNNSSDEEHIPITPIQYASGIVRENIEEDYGKFARTMYDLGVTGANQLPSILVSVGLSAATGGVGGVAGKALSGMSKGAGLAAMGASARGNAYQEMINLGYSKDQANTYANLVAASEVSLQALIGGISKLGGTATKIEKLVSQIDNGLARFAIQFPMSTFSESAEEGLQDILTPTFKNIAAGYNTGEKINWGEVVYSSLLGGIMGSTSNITDIVTTSVATSISRNNRLIKAGERMIKSPDILNAIVGIGVQNGNSEAVTFADKIKNGESVSGKQAGRVLESVVADSITKDGGIMNIADIIMSLEGKNTYFRNSQELFDTAKAVMHMAQGKATEVDNALLSRSSGAVTLLTTVEGNSKALKSIKTAAQSQLRESTPSVEVKTDGAKFKIAYTTENKPVVVIENDILDGVDKSNWVKTAKDAIKKFRPSIPISGRFVKVTKETGREYTNSTYSKKIKNTDEVKYRDKLTASGNLDEIVIASTQYVNEGLKHTRNDDITDFARGNSLLQIGERKYSAEVVIGTKSDGSMVLYDIVNIQDQNFEIKKETNPKPDTSEDRVTSRQDSSPTTRVSQSESSVKSNSMHDGDIYSQGKRVSIPEGAKKSDNIIITEESERFRKKNPEGYKITKILAKDLGMKVMFVDGLVDADGNILDGAITSEGIFINSNAKNIGRFVVTHEFSHRMKDIAPEKWQRYQDYVIEREKVNGRYYDRFNAKAKAYGRDTGVINEEIACDYIGELFGNESELIEFLRQDRGLAVTVRDIYYDVLDRLGLLDEKKKAQLLWRKAYKEAVLNKDKVFEGEEYKTGEEKPAKDQYGTMKDLGLTYDEQSDILEYKSSYSYKINQILYSGKSLTNEEKNFVDRMNRALDKVPVYKGKVYRNLTFDFLGKTALERFVLQHKVGEVITYPSFTSTSKLRDGYIVDGELLVHIEIESINGRDVGNIGITEEDEVLFKAGTEFEVKEINNDENVINISLRECASNGKKYDERVSQNVVGDENNRRNKGNNGERTGEIKISSENTNLFENTSAFREGSSENDRISQEQSNGNRKGSNQESRRNNSRNDSEVGNDGDTTGQTLSPLIQENVLNKKSITGTRLPEYESETSVEESEDTTVKAIPPGAMPRREVVVPRSVQEGTQVRQFARTAAEAETLTDKTSEGVLENVEKGKFNYTPVSDKKAMNNAYASLDAMGVEWVENKVNGAISAHKLDKNTVAMAEALMERYSAEGREDEAQELIINFAAESTRIAQSLQAISMLKKLNPDYEVSYIDKIVENLKEEIIERNNKKWLGKKQDANIEVSEELKTKLRRARTEEERAQIREEIYTQIAEQVPSSWIDKWNAWRYLAMLGNPRTHIRNVLGNAFFMPMIASKNISATIFEAAVDKISGGKIERTKTFNVPKEYKQFALADAESMREELSGGGKHNPSNMIKDKQKVFDLAPLEWMRIKVGDALEVEDWLFLKRHYQNALAQYLAVNKVDLASTDEKTLGRARSIAIKEAQRNTYRDASAFANALSKFSQKNAATAILVEGLMPFKKTPVNVLKRGVEYSPAGLVKALTVDLNKVVKGDITASEYIDGLCAGLTGTGVIALGMLLKSLGLVSGASDDDKEKEFDELTGVQNYSLSIGGHNYTLDWLAPFSLPFFTGVEMQNIMENKGDISFRNIVDTLSNMTEPFFEMSMLQGLTGAVDTIKQANSAETFGNVAWNVATNYMGQAVPTLFGQIARTVDGTQRRSYDDKNKNIPSDLQYFLQSQIKKIPWASQNLEPYVDGWGRQEKIENVFARAINNMFSPGYYSQINVSPMENELQRLYKEVGSEDNMKLFPTPAVKKFNLSDGTEKNLTAKEYTTIQTVQGQTAYDLLTGIVKSKSYKDVDDFTKGSIVSKVYEVASANGKKAVAGNEWNPDSKWVLEALTLIEKGDYKGAEKHITEKGIEEVEDSRYEASREEYKKDFEYDASKYSEAEIGVIDDVESDAATYYASIEKGREYNESDLRHIKVYDEQLKDEMPIEEYAGVRAYAKKTAAMEDGKASMKKDELYNYLESTDYPRSVKSALYEAIGNKGWKNPYTGKKIQ